AELAQLTGESMTTAVIRALELRLEAERRVRQPRTTAERIVEFARRFSEGVPPGHSSSDHARLLYDDSGMPK
ncbi:MAG TPA: type II toxin-antitoxin system VapB family antitoxin, partial [Bryobacteraceae bacterium]|nr:type II toxin-antitoxin system VapB family antitoxin [Bryobacteraceae bacterium]